MTYMNKSKLGHDNPPSICIIFYPHISYNFFFFASWRSYEKPGNDESHHYRK